MDQTFQSGESYSFQLYKTEQGYRLLIEDGDERLETAPFRSVVTYRPILILK